MKPKSVAGLGVVAGILLYLFVPVVLKLQRLNQESAVLKDEIRVLAAKTQTLEREFKLLKEDPVYIEHVARNTFHKSKEGEVVYKYAD